MNKMLLYFTFLLSLILISCSDKSATKKHSKFSNVTSDTLTYQQVDTTYMPTGFYFLSDNRNDKVQMKEEGSNKVYAIAKQPFAAVANINKNELNTVKLEQGDYTSLCMTFDSKGTKDIEEGTGDNSHSKLAVVIAGKLLYVVDNATKIKTGVMCVGLVGYSKEEMNQLKKSVDQKM